MSVRCHRHRKEVPKDFLAFERDLHARVMASSATLTPRSLSVRTSMSRRWMSEAPSIEGGCGVLILASPRLTQFASSVLGTRTTPMRGLGRSARSSFGWESSKRAEHHLDDVPLTHKFEVCPDSMRSRSTSPSGGSRPDPAGCTAARAGQRMRSESIRECHRSVRYRARPGGRDREAQTGRIVALGVARLTWQGRWRRDRRNHRTTEGTETLSCSSASLDFRPR